jgi:hypothetical protein
MIPSPELHGGEADQREDDLDPRLAADLRIAYAPLPALHAVDAAISRAIAERQTRSRASTARPLLRRLRLWMSAPIVALAVLVLGTGVYIHNQGPTPVSAQTILRHVQTAGLVPNQVTYFSYQVTSSTGTSGTRQFWIRADAGVRPAGVLATDAGSEGLVRMLVAAYEVGPGQTPQSSLSASQMAGQRTLDGHVVDVLTLPHRTLYVDAQSYVVRGADWSVPAGAKNGATASSSQARLLQYGTVPLSSVPAGGWQLHGRGAVAGPGAGATKP